MVQVKFSVKNEKYRVRFGSLKNNQTPTDNELGLIIAAWSKPARVYTTMLTHAYLARFMTPVDLRQVLVVHCEYAALEKEDIGITRRNRSFAVSQRITKLICLIPDLCKETFRIVYSAMNKSGDDFI